MKRFINYVMFVSCFIFTLLIVVSSTLNVKAEDVYPFKGSVSSSTLVVHSTPDTDPESYVTEIAYGTVVEVLEKVTDKKIYKVRYDEDKIGYISSTYVFNLDASTLTEDQEGFETYKDYCDGLVVKGFDDSYCPYLYYLHVKYPKWVFTPDKIGVTLEEAADEEEGTGVLPTDNKNYWLHENDIEGGYYFVKANVIASIMDPRNSLFEKNIFQFLDVVDSSQLFDDDTLKAIPGTNVNYGNLMKFIEQYKNVAVAQGVNPVHLMVRSKQEGMDRKNYSGTTGLYTTNNNDGNHLSHQGYTLDGYYNFYNINSYQDKSAGYNYTVQRGLAYAAGFLQNDSCIVVNGVDVLGNTVAAYDASKCGELSYARPWNSPEKAVTGGALFLKAKYINSGQDTVYYQKFNVSSYRQNNDMYSNQYMTNLGAPAEESRLFYNAYIAGNMMNSELNFVIPVYENMPETVYQPVNKSSNNRLSSITINDKIFNEFDPVVVEYNYNLVTVEDTFKIDAKVEDSLSTVEGDGEYTFVDGVAQVKLIVTAEDGSTNSYVLNLKKVVPEEVVTVDDIVSKMAVKVTDNIMYSISPDTAISTLVNTVTKNKGEAKVTDSNGQIKSTGSYATGDKITIIGTNEEKIYTISVKGDTNGDGMVNAVDMLRIQKHINAYMALSNEQFFAADSNEDSEITSVDMLKVQKHINGYSKL